LGGIPVHHLGEIMMVCTPAQQSSRLEAPCHQKWRLCAALSQAMHATYMHALALGDLVAQSLR
jgi:hypothetical protein